MANTANGETVKVKTKSDNNDNVLAAVATIPLVGLIIYYAMPDASTMVKHYAKQSTGLLACYLVVFVITLIPLLGWTIGPLLSLGLLVLWIILLVKALQGDENYMLPVIGDYFDKLLK